MQASSVHTNVINDCKIHCLGGKTAQEILVPSFILIIIIIYFFSPFERFSHLNPIVWINGTST